MRVFLSAYSDFTLAVPMNAVAAMMLYDKKTEKVIQYDQESRNTYISLPRLLKLNQEDVRHGIILREWNSTANKVVLLTAEIKRDIEIPDKEFHPIPKTLGAMRFSKIFSGIKFSDNPILLLNVEQLSQLIQDKQQTINEENNSLEQPPLAEQPSLEQPPPAEPPLPVEPPPAEEPPLPEETPPEEPLPTAASEVEPLAELLVLSELPPEEPPKELPVEEPPPEELPVEEEPEELLVEEPSEELLIEDPPEELLVEDPTEQPLSIADSEVEPLTDQLVLSEDLL